ncbi:hypothetical protein R3P38DRAFT_2788695 [Favolaschia claudopus]|uniref:Uncharacterized protein n=1 Tax=Favolaschia claudopus TaxID=2862362 RepID=A0AAW0AK97_9AGAR
MDFLNSQFGRNQELGRSYFEDYGMDKTNSENPEEQCRKAGHCGCKKAAAERKLCSGVRLVLFCCTNNLKRSSAVKIREKNRIHIAARRSMQVLPDAFRAAAKSRDTKKRALDLAPAELEASHTLAQMQAVRVAQENSATTQLPTSEESEEHTVDREISDLCEAGERQDEMADSSDEDEDSEAAEAAMREMLEKAEALRALRYGFLVNKSSQIANPSNSWSQVFIAKDSVSGSTKSKSTGTTAELVRQVSGTG